MTFSANGEYLLTGDNKGIRGWQVEGGGKQMATMSAIGVRCLAVSANGNWIAAGTEYGSVIVWDAKTYQKVFSHKEDCYSINGVDFSPDSSRLVSASASREATIWDIATRERVQALDHEKCVTAAKYSPQGDRIATASHDSVRAWDSNDGRLLVHIPVKLTPWLDTGLVWFNNHLFIISGRKIKEIEATTGSAVSEWPVPDSTKFSCIALPKRGEFIAYSTQHTITFWDTATRQLGLIQHPQDIRSFAVSPDDRFLAIVGGTGEITINSLPRITAGVLAKGSREDDIDDAKRVRHFCLAQVRTCRRHHH